MPRIFQSEHVYSYKHYTFSYATYTERIGSEPLDPIYDQGFLPYTGEEHADMGNLFYMARSARIDLASFSLSSENRRIKKKFEGRNFTVTDHPASSFLQNKEMMAFCIDYCEKRLGADVMPIERLQRVLAYSPETKVIEYKNDDGVPCAYIIEIQGEESAHYYYSFYDLSLVYLSFGMWLMTDRTEHAQKAGKKHYYLGTVYGDKALYKTNLPSLEYWNGTDWVKDVAALKKRARTDEDRVVAQTDEFKEPHKQ